MKHKIAVTREVFEETLDLLSPHFEITANQKDRVLDAEALGHLLGDKEGVLTGITDRVDDPLLAQCPALKAVCNIGVGYNNIDVAACTRRRVLVTNTPGVLDESTADFAWALILSAARRVTEAERYLRDGQWKRWEVKQMLGFDVHHSTLGIIGLGRIGRGVARRARGFDMSVLYHDRVRADAAIESSCGARYVDREELLRVSDFVVLTVPYLPETHHLVGRDELALMKPTAVLINVSRGGVVDDKALAAALAAQQIGAAGLDVFENEPDFDRQLLGLRNVVLTPHIASASETTRRRMAEMAARNLIAALSGQRPPNLLNPEALG